jgi:hypothetical protein
MDDPKLMLRRLAAIFATLQQIIKACLLFLVFLALLIAAGAATFPRFRENLPPWIPR